MMKNKMKWYKMMWIDEKWHETMQKDTKLHELTWLWKIPNYLEWFEYVPKYLDSKMIGIEKREMTTMTTSLMINKVNTMTPRWSRPQKYTQAAGEGVDRPIKFSISETCVFGSGPTWVSTFTNVILQSYIKAR